MFRDEKAIDYSRNANIVTTYILYVYAAKLEIYEKNILTSRRKQFN